MQLNRERLHRAIRTSDIETVKQLIEQPEGLNLARAKNYFGLYFFLHFEGKIYPLVFVF